VTDAQGQFKNPEERERTVESRYQSTGEDTAHCKNLACAIVDCRVC
jgi:hypothetical protein